MKNQKKKYRRVNVEISNICNLKCPFCPEVARTKGRMNLELFEKIVAQVAPLADELCPHLLGEPLGHPSLNEIFEICARAKLPINLTTNGTLLDDRRESLLLHPALRQVNFSLQSFEANFGERDARQYLNRIHRFSQRATQQRPDLYINYRLWDQASDEDRLTPRASRRSNEQVWAWLEEVYGLSLLDRHSHRNPPKRWIPEESGDSQVSESNSAQLGEGARKVWQPDLRRQKARRLEGRVYLHLDSRFEWPSLESPLRSERGTCHALSNHFGIHADGSLVACCLDERGSLRLGDCNDQPIEEILNSPRALAMKVGFERHQLVEELCKRCDFIKRFDRKKKVSAPFGASLVPTV
jgi:radical SAM protein with 4Fe4S-binding SPASM domain